MSTDRRAPLPLWLFLKRKERKRKGTRPQRHGGAIIPERPSPGQDPLPACPFGPGAAPVTCRSKGKLPTNDISAPCTNQYMSEREKKTG